MSALDDRIDDLYKLPLAEFTAARNALAKTLTSPGSNDAQRVKALAKPTVVPWAVNQLYWRSRKTYDRLLDRGAKLRKAQLAALSGKGDADALREATDAHRDAVAEAAREADRLSGAGAQHLDALTRMLEALSLASEPPQPPGRLTDVLQPAGFEALAGVKPAGPTLVHGSPKGEAGKAAAAEKEREVAEKRRQDLIANAEAAVERARDALAFARQSLERATRAYDEAEARLKQAQKR